MRYRPPLLLLACALGWALSSAAAEPTANLRDPMQPPVAWRTTLPSGPGAPAAEAPPPPPPPRHLMLLDGRRYVIEGGRRLGVGALLGTRRIERIDDDAVTLRGPAGVQRLPLFAGVLKQAPAEAATAATAASAPRARPPPPAH